MTSGKSLELGDLVHLFLKVSMDRGSQGPGLTITVPSVSSRGVLKMLQTGSL